MSRLAVTRKPAAVSSLGAPMLQRMCSGTRRQERGRRCDACANDGTKMRRADNAGAAAATAPAIVREVVGSPGHPLDAATRGSMERRFGHDFGRVRIHADGAASASAHAVGARAYTVGEHIAFANGQYAPETKSGARILAHELTHVLQQPAYAGAGEIRFGGDEGAGHEREAEAVAARVIDAGSPATAIPRVYRMAGAVAGRLMRRMGPELEPPPPPKPEVCEPFVGPPQHPDTVSETMIKRWKGLYAKEGDQGEGCIEHPYVAAAGETVCTIGYGHQIPGCTVLSKATGAAPTAEERKTAKVSDLTCACSDHFDCKGSQADEQLRKDARGAVNYVHKQLWVNLDQAEFDAFVDLTLHHGSIPQTLLDAVKKYWCTPRGKDHVRDIYLETALTRQGSKKIERGFVARRQARVWPASP